MAPTTRADSTPICNVLDGDYVTLDASRDLHYTDAGATCFDDIDGNLNRNIKVSGQVVDLALVGVYTITYDCKNLAGTSAVQCVREVTILDMTCPTCTMNAGPDLIEASFPYYDSGAICTDTMDGPMAVTSIGVAAVNTEATGTYVVTYQTRDSQKNWNNGSPNDHGLPVSSSNTCKGANYYRTVVVVDTLVPVIALQYGHNGSTVLDQTPIHVGYNGDISKADIKWRNPVRKHTFVFGSLMSEDSTRRASVVQMLAVGSGVLGLALLATAALRKKTPETTIVV